MAKWLMFCFLFENLEYEYKVHFRSTKCLKCRMVEWTDVQYLQSFHFKPNMLPFYHEPFAVKQTFLEMKLTGY